MFAWKFMQTLALDKCFLTRGKFVPIQQCLETFRVVITGRKYRGLLLTFGGRGQRCCWISCNTQDILLPNSCPAQNVNGAKAEKPLPQTTELAILLKKLKSSLSCFSDQETPQKNFDMMHERTLIFWPRSSFQ